MGLGLKGVLYEKLKQHIGVVSVLATVASVVGTVGLPLWGSRGTYFSENSLMIGGTQSEVTSADVPWILQTAEEVSGGWDEGYEKIKKIAEGFGAGVSVQGFDGGENLIVKFESHRGFGASAFLLLTSYNDLLSVGVGLGIIKKLVGASYLGLDVYLIVTEGDWGRGVENFASCLTGAPQNSPKLNTGFVKSAVALNFTSTQYAFSSIHLGTLSKNAYQPNMDLVNSVSALLTSGSVEYSTTTRRPPGEHFFEALWDVAVRFLPNVRVKTGRGLCDNFHTFWGYVAEALCGAGEVHGPLRDVGIHSVTLSGEGSGGNIASNIVSTAHVVTGVLRGMNNLCERLHQSFWIYFYTNNKHFVDYDTVQAQVWVGIGAAIASSFTGEKVLRTHDAPPASTTAVILLVFSLFAVVPLHVSTAVSPFLGWVLSRYASVIHLHTAYTCATVCFIASCTVYYAPLAIIASPLLAVTSLLSASSTFRVVRVVLISGCLAVPVLAVPNPEHLTHIPRGFYVGVLLPYISLSVAKVWRHGG